jgi:hypothetical protein
MNDFLSRQPYLDLLKSLNANQPDNSIVYSFAIDGEWVFGKTWILQELENFPPVDILKKSSDMMFNIEKRKSKIIRKNAKLTTLRDRLLPLLMNGQVEVK